MPAHRKDRVLPIRVTLQLRPLGSSKKKYDGSFLIKPGIEVVAPASKLKAAGIKPDGKKFYQLAQLPQ